MAPHLVHGCLMLIERSCDADSVVEPRVDNVSENISVKF